MMWKRDADQREGNYRFEGYLIDLITEISKKLNFEFELYVSPDGNYGSKNSEGDWNGMIRELIVGVSHSQCLFTSRTITTSTTIMLHVSSLLLHISSHLTPFEIILSMPSNCDQSLKYQIAKAI